MDKHLFKKLTTKYKIAWRDYYTGQNLFSVRIACAIFLMLNCIIRVLYFIFPISLSRTENFPEFNSLNWAFLGSGLVFYLLCHLLIEIYRKNQKGTVIMSLFIFVFALYLIFCGMYTTFIATADPRNALVLFLIALIIVSILWVFEFYETVMLIIATELFFTTLLINTNTDPTDMVYNQLVSVILLGGFFLISRYFFSYKSNYYLQMMEISEKTQEIERGSEFKSQALGTVAHDLRNPIASVETVVSMIEMNDIDAELQENINLIKASCKRARTIIDELLESARNENAAQFITVKTELNKFLKDIINKLGLQKDNKNIELISRVVPAYVQINQEKFHRVMDNLIVNALKFSQDNSKIDITLTKNDGYIIIEITDYGIGIPKDQLPVIFEAFTKAGRPGLKGEQSTGLGLSIVKQIVEKHSGTIEVASEEGKGSVFKITLPEEST